MVAVNHVVIIGEINGVAVDRSGHSKVVVVVAIIVEVVEIIEVVAAAASKITAGMHPHHHHRTMDLHRAAGTIVITIVTGVIMDTIMARHRLNTVDIVITEVMVEEAIITRIKIEIKIEAVIEVEVVEIEVADAEIIVAAIDNGPIRKIEKNTDIHRP